jgi:hypothetical protein
MYGQFVVRTGPTLSVTLPNKINFIKERDPSNIALENAVNIKKDHQLFFVNLGGYLPNDMEEYHYKILCVAKSKGEAVKMVKKTAFYQDYNQPSASHIDDHLGVDIDELFKVEDALPKHYKEKYTLQITAIAKENNHQHPEDDLVVGYLKFPK